jgi:hypothetical protein
VEIDYKIVDAKILELKTDTKAGDIVVLSKSVEIDFEQTNNKIKKQLLKVKILRKILSWHTITLSRRSL